MYYSRYDNRPTVGVLALLFYTVVTFAVMLIPIYTCADNPLWVRLFATLFPIAGASAVATVANNLSVVKKNFLLPAFFVIITIGSIGFDSGCWKGYICASIIFFSWYMTITMQNEERCAWRVFIMMASIALGSLISGTMVIFIPLFLLGFAIYERFNLINVSASILGIGFVYLLLYTIAFLFGDINVVTNYIHSLYHPFEILQLSNFEIIVYSTIGLYTIIAFFAFLARFHSNSLIFRQTMLFNYLVLLVVIVIEVLFGEKHLYETAICLLLGVTLPFFAEYSRSKANRILFYSFFLILLLTFTVKNFLL